MKRLLRFLFLSLALSAIAASETMAQTPDPENMLYMDLTYGRVVIQMRPDLAPKHVARIKELTRQGFYDGVVFHRVIEGFMAQGGDPTGTGAGGSGRNIRAEFTDQPFVRGVVGMARTPDSIHTADSQFFIMFGTKSSLNGHYTVWGQVISGMEYVDQIKRGEPPRNPDKIIRMRVAADAEAAQ